jgi:hypothetical protein
MDVSDPLVKKFVEGYLRLFIHSLKKAGAEEEAFYGMPPEVKSRATKRESQIVKKAVPAILEALEDTEQDQLETVMKSIVRDAFVRAVDEDQKDCQQDD